MGTAYDLPEKGHVIMLMHEWIRYRSQQVKQAPGDEEQPPDAEADEILVEPEGDAEADEAPAVAEAEEVAEVAEVEAPSEPEVAEAEVPAEPEVEVPREPEAAAPAETAAADDTQAIAPARTQEAASDADSTLRDREAVLNSLQDELERSGNSMKDRLRQLQARQRQLPMEVEEPEEEGEEAQPRRATETRQQLVQRLLDPTLTLREAALLIDVCPTTVRRYTDRGLLNCFRTPGNQRRFSLSDVLEFLERREQGEV